MREQRLIHPRLARHLANQITQQYDLPRYAQVYPGVFADPDGGKSLIVVCGAAPLSAPALSALRQCGHVDEYIGVQWPHAAPKLFGPKSEYDADDWANEISRALTKTKDVNSVMSTFEFVTAGDPLALANLASASALIAAHMPFELDEVDNGPFLKTLERVVDMFVQEEAAS